MENFKPMSLEQRSYEALQMCFNEFSNEEILDYLEKGFYSYTKQREYEGNSWMHLNMFIEDFISADGTYFYSTYKADQELKHYLENGDLNSKSDDYALLKQQKNKIKKAYNPNAYEEDEYYFTNLEFNGEDPIPNQSIENQHAQLLSLNVGKIITNFKNNNFENVPKKIKIEHLEKLKEYIDKQIKLLEKNKGRTK